MLDTHLPPTNDHDTRRLHALGMITPGVAHRLNNILQILYSAAESTSAYAAYQTDAARSDGMTAARRKSMVRDAVRQGAMLSRSLASLARGPHGDLETCCLKEAAYRLRDLASAGFPDLKVRIATPCQESLVSLNAAALDATLTLLLVDIQPALRQGSTIELTTRNHVESTVSKSYSELAIRIRESEIEADWVGDARCFTHGSNGHFTVENDGERGTNVRMRFPAAHADEVEEIVQ